MSSVIRLPDYNAFQVSDRRDAGEVPAQTVQIHGNAGGGCGVRFLLSVDVSANRFETLSYFRFLNDAWETMRLHTEMSALGHLGCIGLPDRTFANIVFIYINVTQMLKSNLNMSIRDETKCRNPHSSSRTRPFSLRRPTSSSERSGRAARNESGDRRK